MTSRRGVSFFEYVTFRLDDIVEEKALKGVLEEEIWREERTGKAAFPFWELVLLLLAEEEEVVVHVAGCARGGWDTKGHGLATVLLMAASVSLSLLSEDAFAYLNESLACLNMPNSLSLSPTCISSSICSNSAFIMPRLEQTHELFLKLFYTQILDSLLEK